MTAQSFLHLQLPGVSDSKPRDQGRHVGQERPNEFIVRDLETGQRSRDQSGDRGQGCGQVPEIQLPVWSHAGHVDILSFPCGMWTKTQATPGILIFEIKCLIC